MMQLPLLNRAAALLLGYTAAFAGHALAQQPSRFQDSTLPIQDRVEDLVGRMTLPEKVSQMMNNAPAIPRLGIPAYEWWSEGIHGVETAPATVFPEPIGLAATFDPVLETRIATAISDEGRAWYNQTGLLGKAERFHGLTYFAPNINIFRDPRWGRGQETYGEDPYLTGRFGVAYIRALQGKDPKYLKLVATPKHFAVHSGPDPERHRFDAVVSAYDLNDTYLPAFSAAIQQGHAYSIMGSYNRINGIPANANPLLIQDKLRKEWGFEGYVISDYGAVMDIFLNHHYAPSLARADALAVNNGCDITFFEEYNALPEAVRQGLVTEKQIDISVKRLFTARMKLGMFDPPQDVPYSRIPAGVIDSQAHRRIALDAARESIVLLKNEGQILPLSKAIKSIAVIGPNANNVATQSGNYQGESSKTVTVLEAIKRHADAAGIRVEYAKGSELLTPLVQYATPSSGGDAASVAARADAVVFVGGISSLIEGEEGTGGGGDRTSMDLPPVQQDLLQRVAATGKPIVFVLMSGSAMSVNWAQEHVPAIVQSWYPGEEGGTAVADVLFGDYNPAGRLPVTFYKSVAQLPDFHDYSMKSRTYRYFNDAPLYPFGYGLSYTHFDYSDLQAPARVEPGKPASVQVTVRNSGERAGDEVVQLYLRPAPDRPDREISPGQPMPRLILAGFQRVTLAPGASCAVPFTLTPEQLQLVNVNGERTLQPGIWQIFASGGQPDLSGNAGAVSSLLRVE
jgi:beta-glucosidase